MKRPTIASISIYRWRYTLTYIAVATVFVGLLLLVSLFIPGGISTREMTAVATSSALSWQQFSPEMVINLPYYALQRAALELLGLSTLTIKLPTIILAALSGLGLVLLLRTWFRKNVALLTALTAFTIGPFLLSAQSGTPGILYIFWPVWMLYAGVKVARRSRFRLWWKIVLLVLAAGSLYTPLSLYVLIALLSAVVLHPHLRHIARQLNKVWLAGAACFAALALAPLLYAIALQPTLLLRLLGIDGAIDLGASLGQLTAQYLSFMRPLAGIVLTPVYSLPIVIIMLAGLYHMLTMRHTARSYILLAWMVLLVPPIVVNPELVAVTFVPAVLLTGYGLDLIIRSWYKLFPKNPYARVAGLVPITILIITLGISGIDRFVYGYLYGATPAHVYSKDVALLSRTVGSGEASNVTLVVDASERPFYDAFKRYNPALSVDRVVTVSDNLSSTSYQDAIVTSQANRTVTARPAPYRVITDGASTDADRFYLYKSISE